MATSLVIVLPIQAASASTFTVNRTADGSDSNPGNGTCFSTSAGGCTVRAAIEEANAHKGPDTIHLPGGTFTLTSTVSVEDDTTIIGAGATSTRISGGGTILPFYVRTVEYLVCDLSKDRLASYDRNGQWNGTFSPTGAGSLDGPVAAHLTYNATNSDDPDVLVTGASGVHRFSATGAHEARLVNASTAGIAFPEDAVPGPSSSGTNYADSIYLADYYPNGKVRKYSQTGAAQGTFVAHGSGGLSTPSNIAFHGSSMYVVDSSSNRVLRYNATTGAYQGYSPTGNTPRDILFRPNGSFVVTNAGDGSISQYSAAGVLQGVLVSAGSGGLSQPTGLELGPDNALLVVSTGTNSILRYDLTTGAYRGVFVTGGSTNLGTPSCLLRRTSTAANGPSVTFSKLTVFDGHAAVGSPGALVVDRGATVSIADSVFRDNYGSTFGGAIGNYGNLTVLRSSVRNNKLPQGGGGVTSSGGGIYNAGTLHLDRSSVTSNFATRGGGIAQSSGTTWITNSTISSNTASGGSGGGIYNHYLGRVNISFSTITLNQTVSSPDTDATRRGGGIDNEDPGAKISMAGTILADNTDGRSSFDSSYGPDCYSPTKYNFTSERSNLVGIVTSTCNLRDSIWGTATFGNIVGTDSSPVDPDLDPLARPAGFIYGVQLPSHYYSPGVDAATSGSSSPLSVCPATDQLGHARPTDGDGDGTAVCDIGSIER